MCLWMLSLIKFSTSIFWTDVRLITHTFYTTIFPSNVSISVHHAHPSSGSSSICIHLIASMLLLPSQRDRPPKHLARKTFDPRNWSNPSSNLEFDWKLETDIRKKRLLNYSIDFRICIFCGNCIEYCPTNCLSMT